MGVELGGGVQGLGQGWGAGECERAGGGGWGEVGFGGLKFGVCLI